MREKWLGDSAPLLSDVFHQLVESSPLHFLVLDVGDWVQTKVEDHRTLLQLLDEELFSFCRTAVWGEKLGTDRQRLSL